MTEHPPESPDAETGRYRTLAVLGAGAWGAALAVIAARAGAEARLWTRRPEHAREMATTRRNPGRLPEAVTLPAAVTPTADLAAALSGAEAVLLAVPSHALRETARAAAGFRAPAAPVAVCAKGIECGTGLLMTDIVRAAMGAVPLAALSGPNFADETALGQPTATTIASDCGALFRDRPEATAAARLARTLGTATFRPYVSDDLVGAEVGGAVKNVIAIVCGVAAGAGFAANARAALVTRGLDEIMRLAVALGGRRETVMGLSGLGDLTLTCSSERSRNMRLGMELGAGVPRAACFEGRPVLAEGERSALSVTDLARRLGLRLPICEAARAILHEGAPIADATEALLNRPLRGEPWDLALDIGRPAPDR